jgi:hypothetical protein
MTIPHVVVIVFALSMYAAMLVSEAHWRKLEKSEALAVR